MPVWALQLICWKLPGLPTPPISRESPDFYEYNIGYLCCLYLPDILTLFVTGPCHRVTEWQQCVCLSVNSMDIHVHTLVHVLYMCTCTHINRTLYTCVYYRSYINLIGVHELHGWLHPNWSVCGVRVCVFVFVCLLSTHYKGATI